jgi:hypothetical protein
VHGEPAPVARQGRLVVKEACHVMSVFVAISHVLSKTSMLVLLDNKTNKRNISDF